MSAKSKWLETDFFRWPTNTRKNPELNMDLFANKQHVNLTRFQLEPTPTESRCAIGSHSYVGPPFPKYDW